MPLTHCTLPVRGLTYYLHDSGPADAPLMLFLHGLLDTGASFAPLIEAVQHAGCDYRCVAPDWRGHGDSERAHDGYWFPDYLADLDALLNALAPDQPVTLVGHSMGGQIASMYAGIRPQAVARLITLDSLNLADAPTAGTPERYRSWLDAVATPPRQRRYSDLAQLAARIGHQYPELDTPTRLFLATNWARETRHGDYALACDARHFQPFPYGFRLAEAQALWREVTAPTLCIDGGASPAGKRVSAADMTRRRACFAHLTHATLDACGHMLHVQAPQRVAAVMARFLAAPAADRPQAGATQV